MNILFISDNAREVKLFRSALHKIDSNIRFESCHKLNEALHKIYATDVRLDFIFLNYDLLKNNAYRVLNSLHSTQNAPDIILVLLSSITSA